MKRRDHFPSVILFLIAAVFVFTGCRDESRKEDGEIHIALAATFSGESADSGQSVADGVNLCLDEINEAGGIDGRRIVLDMHDDANDPETAEAVARKIAMESPAVAVIGHYYSSCSIRAGKVYAEKGVPAVSPTSTNIRVTADNDWYFRTIFNDRLQGRFLASYAKHILEQPAVSIVYEDDAYGSYLAEVFEEASRELGTDVRYKWRIAQKGEDSGNLPAYVPNAVMTADQIADELKNRDDAGIVFLATHGPKGAELVKMIRDNGIKTPLIGADSFASASFTDKFRHDPKEQKNPGYYSDGIYVSSALIFDTANESAHGFRERFRLKYGKDPSAFSAIAYDTAMILVRAIRDEAIVGKKEALAKDRKAIRDHLAKLTDMDRAVEGVAGITCFDADGNSTRPIRLGIYKSNQIISAPTQLQVVSNVNEIPDLETALARKTVILVDGRHMYKTNVVFTGVEFNKIGEIDLADMTCDLDFDIWFRYRSEMDVQDITFLNAAETVSLGKPIEETSQNRMNYRLYRVRGKFKLNFHSAPYVYGRQIAGVSFRHNVLTRRNLLFVSDLIGMGVVKGNSPLERMRKRQVLSRGQGWKIANIRFFQSFSEKNIQGSPEYINFLGGTLDYSVFNVGVRIEKYVFSIRGWGPRALMRPLAGVAVLMLAAGLVAGHTRRFAHRLKSVWAFQAVSVTLLLLAGEIVCSEWLAGLIDPYYMKQVKLTFDILWWVVPAFLIDLAFKPFVWKPIEERAERTIPNIVRRFVSFIIYILMFFGIIAFVFNQKLTGLLATSGVVAMIIGLAIQINISNIFSGIAINIEHPFRIGDWVKIADHSEGKVIDITWRTTRITTRDGAVLGIPNSLASESVFHNYSYPNDVFEEWIFVYVDPIHPNEGVEKILRDAALATDSRVLSDPAPFTRLTGVGEWAAKYLVGYCINDFAKRNAIRNHVWTRILHHMRYAGIPPAIRDRQRHMYRETNMTANGLSPLEILNEIDIFRPFSDEAKFFLSGKMRPRLFAGGETIFRQDAQGDSLFVIVEGVVGVHVHAVDGKTIEVARLGVGHFFGEMSLMTGEPRTASIICISDTRLFEIRKESLKRLLDGQPEISELIARILTDRKLATSSALENAELKKQKETTYRKLLGSINSFFGKPSPKQERSEPVDG